ncbi:MAG TPA: DUF4156 domain-containing protein [Rudaea sp.]|jgi:hypothetical protein
MEDLKKWLLAVAVDLLVTLVSGCAVAPSAAAARVQEADAQIVASCKYLGDVQGSSGWGNLAASAGMENAKSEARESAAKLGATHIVWNNITGGSSPYVSGKAYRCQAAS